MPEMRLNRKRSVKDGTPNWYDVMVAELGSCQDVFFQRKSCLRSKKKDLSQLAYPPRSFVGWCTIVSCWFLLLDPAKGTVGMVFLGSQFLWNNWPTAWLLEVYPIFLSFLEWELVASKPSCLITLWTCSSFALHFTPRFKPTSLGMGFATRTSKSFSSFKTRGCISTRWRNFPFTSPAPKTRL